MSNKTEVTEDPIHAELSRIKALDRYDLADAPHDPALDDIARLAAQLCELPAAVVALVTSECVLLCGRHGIQADTLPLNSTPCETTISAEGIYQIPDTRRELPYFPRGIQIGETHYRFYAAAPILTPQSVAIGCVAVFDRRTRKLEPAQLDALECLSHMATTRLELVRRMRQAERGEHARKRVESALTVERNFVSAVLDTVGALVVVSDTNGRIVRFNRACELISGYSSSALLGEYAWERLIPDEDVAAYIENFERVRSGQFPASYEDIWVAADGSRRRIAWSATALIDAKGQANFIIATGIDVTVQRVAEASIRESEARYRQIVEGSLGMVCTHGLDGRIISINESGALSLGYTVDSMVGTLLTEYTVPSHQSGYGYYYEQLQRNSEADGMLYVRCKNGEERVLAYRNRLVQPHGEPPYVLAFGFDITAKMQAEEQLRVLIRQSNSVLESVGDGIIGLDLERRITVVNPAAAQMLGYTVEDLLGQPMHELLHHTRADGSPYPRQECPIQTSLSEWTTVRVNHEVFWRKDGTSFPVEYIARPQIEVGAAGKAGSEPDSPESRAVGVVVAFSDISERNALDQMKDEFISTISHELRTPLTALRGALGLIGGGALAAQPEKARQMMDMAITNTDRLVRLVNDILDLERIGSGKADLHSVTCSMQDLMTSCTMLMEAEAAKANVKLVVEANGVQVYADPDRVLQMLANLVMNAIKFSPQNSPSEVRLTARYEGTDEARMEVSDQGRGIPEEMLQTVFQRFKQVDASDARIKGGSGLGLAICQSIAAQHGGRIWVTSQLGQGSTFHFTLPTKASERLS